MYDICPGSDYLSLKRDTVREAVHQSAQNTWPSINRRRSGGDCGINLWRSYRSVS